MSETKPEVMALGEDGEQWLVLNAANDDHAVEAAREHEQVESGYLAQSEDLYAQFRTDLVWRHGGLKPSRFADDTLLFADEHFQRHAQEAKRVFQFAGHLVSTAPFDNFKLG